MTVEITEKKSDNFFHIERTHLKDDRIFAFHLFIYHPLNQSYTLYLHANSPLTTENSDFLNFILEKGGELAIEKGQERAFLKSMAYQAADIPSLRGPCEDQLEREQREILSTLDRELKSPFSFKEALNQSCRDENYSALIARARLEMSSFSPRLSPTVSLATFLAKNLLREDNFTNRVVAVSYFLAKNMDITDESSLAELGCAAFLAHIGHTQLDLFYAQNAGLNYSSKQQQNYQKHAGLAHHLIRKSKSPVSERTMRIIESHHERYDGRGYPRGVMGAQIDPLALILGAVAHIFEYAAGRITGNEVPLATVLRNLADKTFAPGLEFQFGDTIYENLINLLVSQTEEKAA